MPISLVGRGNVLSGQQSNFSPSLPSGIAEGDLLILVLAATYNSNISAPTGWTLHNTNENSTLVRQVVCYKFAGSSETAPTVSYYGGSNQYATGCIVAYRGVDSTTPFNTYETSASTGFNFSATGVTTTVDDCVVLVAGSIYLDAATSYYDIHSWLLATDIQFNEIVDCGIGSKRYVPGVLLADTTLLTAGSTGTITAQGLSFEATATTVLALTPANHNRTVYFKGTSGTVASTGSVTITPSTSKEGDLLLLCAVGYDAVPDEPSGWTTIGTITDLSTCKVRICYKISTGSEGDVTIPDSGSQTVGAIFVFTNINTENFINSYSSSYDSDSVISFTSPTTTVKNCLMVCLMGYHKPYGTADDIDCLSSWNCSSLETIPERFDYGEYISYNNVTGVGMACGIKAEPGAVSNIGVTGDYSTLKTAGLVIALAPALVSSTPPLRFNIGDTYYEPDAVYVNIGGTWKTPDTVKSNVAYSWKDTV